jgi:hypothetical protein
MPFVEMDPELVFKLIEGYSNELVPENRKMESFYRQFSCPACGGGGVHKEYVANHAFADPSQILPRALLRCAVCSCLFNPHQTSAQGVPMIVEAGSPSKSPMGHIIHPDDE